MTGILAKQLFLHPCTPERAVNVHARVCGPWRAEAVRQTSPAPSFAPRMEYLRKSPAVWTVVNCHPASMSASDLRWTHLFTLLWFGTQTMKVHWKKKSTVCPNKNLKQGLQEIKWCKCSINVKETKSTFILNVKTVQPADVLHAF